MTESFLPLETERYARHLVMPEIGGPGQQKLKAARVFVLGAGGLGAPVLQYLAAAGVGHITIVDDDLVSLSNLQRQVIYSTATIGRPKVNCAAAALNALNPHVSVTPVNQRMTGKNAEQLLDGHTLALDGSDNFQTRYLLADSCAAARIPLISAAINRFDGNITTLMPWIEGNPGYRDLFPVPPDDGLLPTCAETGVLGAMTGLMGTLQALEAIKQIAGIGDGLVGKLLMVDAMSLRFETIQYRKRA